MESTSVIIRPLVTEKSTHFANEKNVYAFQVHTSANKIQIKDAVQELYSVKVLDVRTINRKGKPRRTKKGEIVTPTRKRAIVKLHEDSRIDLI